ncbi:MAG: EamA family transporter [Halobacteriovoraceae bacterium]|nr:EamA family transporter [Halobacteriovoraceae bacterium]MCB9095128.1 EamA family transporter [Halobacteriovoraceae bacterium]
MSSLFIIFACFLWAFDTLIRYPLVNEGVPSITIVFIEHSYLLVILLILFRKKLKILFQPKLIFSFLMVGSFGSALATLAFTESFTILNPSLVILLQKLQPVVAIVLAKIVLKERTGPSFFLWASVSIAGAILIGFEDFYHYFSGPHFESSKLFTDATFSGYLYVFIAIAGWGCATVYGKKLVSQGLSEWEIMMGRFTYGFMALAAFSWQKEFFTTLNLESLYKIGIMVLFSGLLAMYFYYRGLKNVPAKRATLLELFFPLSAVFVNWVFLGHSLNVYQWVGGSLLVMSSVVLQQKRY